MSTVATSSIRKIDAPTLFIPRHGSTEWNTGDPDTERAKGQKDMPLSDTGHKEAVRDGKFLAQYPIAEIHHGELSRSKESARHIADETGARAIQDGPLPWDIGYLTGQLRKDIADRVDYYIRHDKRPVPDGESHADVRDRVESFLAKLLKKAEGLDGKALAWVSHSDEMQIVRAFLTGGDPVAVEAGVGPAPATILRVTKQGGKWTIREIGCDGAPDET